VNHTYLAFHAEERPQDLVFTDGTRAISYAEQLRDLKKFIRAASALGLVPGNSVAIGCDDFYSHWLLILAFEYLGIASASFHANEGSTARALLGAVDLVLAEPHYPPGGWKTRAITPQWLQSIRGLSDEAPPPPARWQPDQPVRIVRTSGTTGEAKRFHMSYAGNEARLQQLSWLYRGQPDGSGSLITLSFAIGATYHFASLALRGGRAVVAASGVAIRDLPARIRQHRLSSLTLLPVQIKELLEELPPDWVKPERLEIRSFGAPISDALRYAAQERLADRIVEIYGSNEIGTIAVTLRPGTDGFGTLMPNVAVEIVDEAGTQLPDGAAGEIRLRGVGRFAGYVDDPSLTRRMLRDGWFYPGDLGILEGRSLQITGRIGDQVNLGGVKFGLAKIEAAAQRSGGAGLEDVGAVPIPNAAGLNELHVALVTDGSDDRGVVERVSAVLGTTITGGVHLIRLPQIPRNDAGKIDRAKLEEAILAIRAAAKG
jgi:acyl-coenzyme A synthetase/AMP-(fatty) acid ligase